jgi:predicted metal-dependent peptidase
MTETLQKLTRARTQLLLDHPFFGELALRLRLTEDPAQPTLAVDGRSIFYNPMYVDKLSTGLTRAILAHEVLHCVFDHIGRRNNRTPTRWNHATDYATNQILVDSGFNLEDTGLLNPAYKGMTADQIYNLLPESTDNAPGPGEKGGAFDNCMDGDLTQTEVNATDWKIATIQAANAAKEKGALPASLARLVEELTTPKINWKDRLRRFVTEISKDDYSWIRLSRRFLGQGLFLPSLYSESMGEIVVAIDTSGSISQEMLNIFGAEIKAIVQSVRPQKTIVVYCDAKVNHVDEFTPDDELKFTMHGGGGTDFCPPFKLLEEQNKTPACFVYLTDGYGPFPGAPTYPVLWCCTTDVIAPFGETLPIEI